MNNVKKIAVLRALQLGDFLCSIPALRALRTAYPEANISWIGLPGNQHLQQRFSSYVDHFIVFPGYPGLPEQTLNPLLISNFIEQVQEDRYDLILQMQGNGKYTNPLVSLFAARYCAGFYKEGDYKPNDEYFIPYPEELHEVERHLMLLQHLGIPAKGDQLEFPFNKDINYLGRKGLDPQQYICIHPGSRGRWRQWDPALFAHMADLVADLGYIPVLTGSKNELDITQHVLKKMRKKALVVTGETNLDEMASLLFYAKGLLANCTGVAHIAYALNTPTVIVSMDGEPRRWGQHHSPIHRMVDWLSHPDINLVISAFHEVIVKNSKSEVAAVKL